MHTIKTDNLTKRFNGLVAVDGLTLTVSQGELFGLIGSDGAGKTTTIRMLTGIMDPTAGDAWVLGRQLPREAEAIKHETGYMSQRFGLYPDLTVSENIRFFADIYGLPRRERQEKTDRLLAFSKLGPFSKRKAGNLSGGMKQKLGLVCALIHTPKVLFLDEPTSGVDPVSRRDFWRILHQLLKEKVTIFVSTAYLDEADRCDRVGLIHNGKLIACDTPTGLKKLMRGTILEVRSGEPRRLARLLREQLRDVVSVGLFGDKVHVVSMAPQSAMSGIEETCRQKGLPLGDIRLVEPNMEDIFVSALHEEKANNREEGNHG